MALEPFHPEPNTIYSLETTAHLSGISRRMVLIYCRRGLVRPLVEPSYGALHFNAEAIQTIRRAEYFRWRHGIDLSGVKLIADLLQEVERLRSELRFLRGV